MFTPRCLAIFALIATAVALPASEKPIPKPITTITNDDFGPALGAPWFSVPYFGDITKIFAPLWKLFPSFEELGPRINVNEDKFQVIVQVKDYAKDDLKVKVKGDFIYVQGTHEAKEADHDLFASQFFHTYTLPANSSAADVTAELTNDGYLIVNAPITSNSEASKETDRVVPILDTGAPFKKEEASAASEAPETLEIPEAPEKQPESQPESPVVSTITTSVPEIVSEEDRKEPTTPQTDREDVTENDNEIPHGSEINDVTP